MTSDDPFIAARALVLRDLHATDVDSPPTVSLLEHALDERRWWLDHWADGRCYAAVGAPSFGALSFGAPSFGAPS